MAVFATAKAITAQHTRSPVASAQMATAMPVAYS